jgi:hypothetical protein
MGQLIILVSKAETKPYNGLRSHVTGRITASLSPPREEAIVELCRGILTSIIIARRIIEQAVCIQLFLDLLIIK